MRGLDLQRKFTGRTAKMIQVLGDMFDRRCDIPFVRERDADLAFGCLLYTSDAADE